LKQRSLAGILWAELLSSAEIIVDFLSGICWDLNISDLVFGTWIGFFRFMDKERGWRLADSSSKESKYWDIDILGLVLGRIAFSEVDVGAGLVGRLGVVGISRLEAERELRGGLEVAVLGLVVLVSDRFILVFDMNSIRSRFWRSLACPAKFLEVPSTLVVDLKI
jgi:hypothetical protein